MGGKGSGRHYRWDAGATVDDMRRLDVRRLSRDGLLKPSQSYSWQWSSRGETIASINIAVETDRLWLSYRSRTRGATDWEDMKYAVPLVTTPCHLRGERHWFLCPAQGCGRRAAALYGGRRFACRQCHGLAYPSQREKAFDRQARRAEKIRERLGWEPGILNGRGWERPKGMHWKTYERLLREYDNFERASLRGMLDHFGVEAEAIIGDMH